MNQSELSACIDHIHSAENKLEQAQLEISALHKTLLRLQKQANQSLCSTSKTTTTNNSLILSSKRAAAPRSPVNLSDKVDGDDIAAFFSDCSKRAKIEFTEDDGKVVVYTDGACENNGKAKARAGIGVWFGDNHPCNVSKPVQGRATNNTAEIQACQEAIRVALDHDVTDLKIITDSKFVMQCMNEWMPKWKRNNWKTVQGKDVINKEELIKLDALRTQLSLTWEHVNSHIGIKGNECADKLAREGAARYKS